MWRTCEGLASFSLGGWIGGGSWQNLPGRNRPFKDDGEVVCRHGGLGVKDEVVAGGDHTVVRLKSGAILTCGLGERGVLGHGNGDYSNKLVPTRVTLPSPPAHWAGRFGVPAIVSE